MRPWYDELLHILFIEQSPVIVSWYKLNGQMPYGSEQDNGMLHLYDLQIHDSGVYICQARNNDTQKTFEDKVSITISGMF